MGNNKANWSDKIQELELYFKENKSRTPIATYDLKSGGLITDVPKFIDSHLSTVKQNNGNPTFLPYLERLIELKESIK